MTIVTGSQIRDVESRVFDTKEGYRADISMSLAGKALADTVMGKCDRSSLIAVVCGYGNNGGDGFAAAYFLYAEGFNVSVLFEDDCNSKLSPESHYFYSLCAHAQIISAIDTPLTEYAIIVDCLLGVGLSGTPRDNVLKIIKRINACKAYVISADIPSGLPADGPVIHDSIVRASKTVAMQFPKVNTMIYPGKKYTGELQTVSVGLPLTYFDNGVPRITTIDEYSIISSFSADNELSIHKYNKGHLLVIGGFNGMEGAAILAADSALAAGAGLVTIATHKESRNIIAGIIPEVMTIELPESFDEVISFLSDTIKNKKIDAVLIGPGLGRSTYSSNVFNAVIRLISERCLRSLLIDGDALYHLAACKWKAPDECAVIITPHSGEGASILNTPSAEVNTDLYNSAIRLSEMTHATTVLKGSSTVVCSNNEIRIWTGGIPSLATAGSGDVLSGIIASLMIKKGMSSTNAASLGVFIHGMCALHGKPVIKATDIITSIPDIISRYLKA